MALVGLAIGGMAVASEVGQVPFLALCNSNDVEILFSSDFRADSLACLVMPPKDTAVMATRMPMMTMTMRSSMMVKPREAVEAFGIFDNDLKDLVL